MANPRLRQSGPDMSTNPNIFDDEYETDVPDTELDHRPARRNAGQESNIVARVRSRASSRPTVVERSTLDRSELNNEEEAQAAAWRNSTAKNPRGRFVTESAGPRMLSQDVERRSRPISTALEFAHHEDRSSAFVAGRSGLEGNSNGFSQSGLPRMSMASSIAPSRPRSDYMQANPAFPYAMYNQTILPADDDIDPEVLVRVGVPARGAANDFQRKIGPDGEEQDIVGPDGHTEQLPPYSQYPDGDAKPAPIVVAAIVPDAPTTPPVGPGSISSMVDLPPGTPRLESATPSVAVNTLNSSLCEKKSWKKKTFTEKRRTRICCGMPLWMFLSLIAVVLLCGAIIGIVIGVLMATSSKR